MLTRRGACRHAHAMAPQFGLYEQWKAQFADDAGFMPFHYKIAGGFFSGATGAVIG